MTWDAGGTTYAPLPGLIAGFFGPVVEDVTGHIRNINAATFEDGPTIVNSVILAHIAFDLNDPGVNAGSGDGIDVWFDTNAAGTGFSVNGDQDSVKMNEVIIAGSSPDVFDACLDPARIDSGTPLYYLTLQDAYDAALDGETIQSQDIIFSGDLFIDRNILTTFESGYDCSYVTAAGVTTISGNMTVSQGTLTIGNGTFQLQ
jgi:hypothetical protein